jgi:hypothetical protein
MSDVDELEEIKQKEEDLYPDLIEPKDKLRYRHPLFIILAIIALIAVIFFAVDYFFINYPRWRKDVEKKDRKTSWVIKT